MYKYAIVSERRVHYTFEAENADAAFQILKVWLRQDPDHSYKLWVIVGGQEDDA